MVPGKLGPPHELAKLITGRPSSSKKSIKKAIITTSTLEEAHTVDSLPPSWPQLLYENNWIEEY